MTSIIPAVEMVYYILVNIWGKCQTLCYTASDVLKVDGHNKCQ